MANKSIDMNKVRKVLKLHFKGKSKSFISKYLSLSRNTVKKYVFLSQMLQLDQNAINEISDAELEKIFSKDDEVSIPPKLQALYDFFPYMERELKKTGVTKSLMWEEYTLKHPQGYKSSQFKEYYMRWSKKVNPVMHMNHKAGDKMFIDYAGKTLQIIDKESGEITVVQFFVAILGASQYTYAEASLSQKKEDFVASVENALHYFNGVPAVIVPDNLKSAVTKSNRYEPKINETFLDFAEHYETTIIPARAYKPRDKSLAEGAVKILYRRIYPSLRNKNYFSLKELNEAIWDDLEKHNNRKLTGRPHSRFQLFKELEQKELAALPVERFEIKEVSMATVMKISHVMLSKDKHYYSVPYQYIRKKVKIMYTSNRVEIFYNYNRIAIHQRNYKPYNYTTITEHMPSSHQFLTDWNPQKFINWGNSIDSNVGQFITSLLEVKQHPEQAYKSCIGVLSLATKVGNERLTNACKRALDYKIYNYKTIQNILERGMDVYADEKENDGKRNLPNHQNIRGENYYK
ncbi:MAG: IS21 family transposase [Bacteroidetes bacterium]|jgi:transposase|nr:IS21 family transposase [Bacteroidota bacterium]MBT4969987.1 IS21 family transposase [Bacteroidota bacterium]MBT5527569.1 IS21 family transposase [Cytophagia bacterium]MBT6836973.1 IS21 family transposase [Bacteroidota bacterium]